MYSYSCTALIMFTWSVGDNGEEDNFCGNMLTHLLWCTRRLARGNYLTLDVLYTHRVVCGLHDPTHEGRLTHGRPSLVKFNLVTDHPGPRAQRSASTATFVQKASLGLCVPKHVLHCIGQCLEAPCTTTLDPTNLVDALVVFFIMMGLKGILVDSDDD